MHLQVGDSVVQDTVGCYIRRDHAGVYDGFLKAHGKKRIRISAEGLCIEEIPPAAYDLAGDEPQHAGICKLKEGNLFNAGIDDGCQDGCEDAAVNGQTPAPDIQDFKGVLSVVSPFKCNIIKACADDGQDNGIEGKIQIKLRILSPPFCIPLSDSKAQKHAGADDDAVKGNAKAEYSNVIRQMLNDDPQMRKDKICSVITHGPSFLPGVRAQDVPPAVFFLCLCAAAFIGSVRFLRFFPSLKQDQA